MYLKEITLHGFKSFANRTSLNFDGGFTAVVGPNGSGKSNVTEAVQWVLGEQSAKALRGESMDDVIFQGSTEKRPAPYAEVTLLFDNLDRTLTIDSDEVSFTRRLTRNGESSYRINGKLCRLKDITNLTMDTGIGRDSFSIISQGQVERIFTQKAEQRRQIFEEIAGVVAYKNRKKEAQKKLAQAADNLHRIEDILHEISDRLGPLKHQRDDALAYRAAKAELSEIEIALLSVQIENTKQQWDLHREQLANSLALTDDKKRVLQEKEEQLASCQAERLVQEAKESKCEAAYYQSEQDLQAFAAKNQLLAEQHNYLERELTLLIQHVEELAKDKASREAEKANQKQTLREIEASLAKLESESQTLAANWANLEAKDQLSLDDLRDRYIDDLQQQTQAKNALVQSDIERQRLSQQAAKLAQQLAEKQEKYLACEEEGKKLKAALTAWQEEQTALNEAKSELISAQKALETSRQEKVSAYQEIERQLLAAKTQYESLQALKAKGQGLYFGVKNVLAMQKDYPGIHGAVADIVNVHPDHTQAVETALGSSLQHIVVDSDRLATQLVDQLKKKSAGRATFLPLNIIQGRTIPKSALELVKNEAGFLGVLADLVETAPTYRPIINNLLGTTLLVASLEAGRKCAQKLKHHYRLVTLDGDLFNVGGAISGGQRKQNTGDLLQREQRLKGLNATIKEKSAILQKAQHRAKELEAKSADLLEQETALTKEAESLQAKGQRIQGQLLQVNERKEHLDEILGLAQFDLDEVNEALKLTEEQHSLALSNLTKAKAKVQASQEQMANQEAAASSIAAQKAELNEKRQALHAELAVKKEQKKAQAMQVSLSQKRLQELEEKIASQKVTYQAKQAELKQVYQELEDRKIAYKAAVLAQKERKADYEALKEKRQEEKAFESSLSEQITQINRDLQGELERQAEITRQVSRYEVALDNLLDHLNETYGLTYERACELRQLDISMEKASQQVKQLKNQLSRLGTVNLQAIEEYEEVKDRYDFLVQQQADAKEAKRNIELAIQNMDEEVARRFEETFTAVKNAFTQVFPELFGGGEATLKLEQPEDLLNTGVEIMARPPGKKWQLLSLLSGGERALTAIALLFSILKVRPVPFAILDEVEAALDEANVQRYGQYLSRYQTQTQFIVITHRKGTMASANVLYGVTMQEAGISKLASVRMADYEEFLAK